LALDLGNLQASGLDPFLGIARVRLGTDPADAIPAGTPAPPTARPGRDPAWSSMIGLSLGRRDRPIFLTLHGPFAIDQRCPEEALQRGLVSVTGVALRDPARIVVGCGGVRRVPLLTWRDGAAIAPIAPGAAPSARETTASEPIRPLAAGMLAVAALGTGAAAAVARLRRRPEPPDAPPDDPSAISAGDPAQPREPGPPRLTLVRVPREHGP
jgi:hypothetical protein